MFFLVLVMQKWLLHNSPSLWFKELKQIQYQYNTMEPNTEFRTTWKQTPISFVLLGQMGNLYGCCREHNFLSAKLDSRSIYKISIHVEKANSIALLKYVSSTKMLSAETIVLQQTFWTNHLRANSKTNHKSSRLQSKVKYNNNNSVSLRNNPRKQTSKQD